MAAADLRTSGEEPEGAPTVIVEDLHVVYRVHGRGEKGNAVDALKRMVRGQRRPGTREIHAVRGVNLVARRGDAIGVIGRNGSGKSTLLRAVAGLLPPDRGHVFTEGQPSLLGVNAALVRDLTGARNIELGCLAMGMSPDEVRAKFDEIVEFSGIGESIDLPMRTYSSGMAARLRFAIAAAKSHEVLLIDEALATGDRQFRRRSRQRMNELREEAGTLFLVSHSLDVIQESCNRVIWVDRGALRMEGDPASVIEAYSEEE
jgi:teichoic acid transport system ATP-binding protein